MARRPRIIGEYLHVIARGIGKQILFENDADRLKYLSLLQRHAEETNIIFLAYCLMDNHVHLLIRDKSQNVALFMKKIGISYAYYYNQKYERTGHLFQNRYKSNLIKSDSEFFVVYRYILNNPDKAGICSASTYTWSSYHEFVMQKGLTDFNELRKIVGNNFNLAEFVKQAEDAEVMEADTPKHDDEWAALIIRKTLDIKSGTELQKYDKAQRDTALRKLLTEGISIRQLERLTGINRGVIFNAKVDKEIRPRCQL